MTNQWGMFLGNMATRGSGSLGLLGFRGTVGRVGEVALEFASSAMGAMEGLGWNCWGACLGGEGAGRGASSGT